MLRKTAPALILCLLSWVGDARALTNTPPEVTSVVAQQRPHTGLVDVVYDVVDAEGDPLNITLWYSLDGGTTWDQECQSVTGDVGPGVTAGTARSVTWDAGADVPDLDSQQFRVRVYADDGVGTVTEDFTRIEAGTFFMGTPEGVPSGPDETLHEVTLTTPFEMAVTEVTGRQYVDLLQWAYDEGYCVLSAGTSPVVRDNLDGSTQELFDVSNNGSGISFENGTFQVEAALADLPVHAVTWYGAAAYCDWLSLREGLPRAYDHFTWQCNERDPYRAQGYRLPTEAEWEYACRAGSTTAFATGPMTNPYGCDYDPALAPAGWYCWQTLDPQPVGQKLANSWGLFDMHGNVLEWCNDTYDTDYGSEPVTDPVGPVTGTGGKVHRGGNVLRGAQGCRSAERNANYPNAPQTYVGFRPVRSVQ